MGFSTSLVFVSSPSAVFTLCGIECHISQLIQSQKGFWPLWSDLLDKEKQAQDNLSNAFKMHEWTLKIILNVDSLASSLIYTSYCAVDLIPFHM